MSTISAVQEPHGVERKKKNKKKSETELSDESAMREFEKAEELVILWVEAAAAADNSSCLLTALVSVVNHFKPALQDMPLKYSWAWPRPYDCTQFLPQRGKRDEEAARRCLWFQQSDCFCSLKLQESVYGGGED